MAFVPLIWTNFRNTDAYPNANDLRKISGDPSLYDADAVSSEEILSAIEGYGIKFLLEPATFDGVACGLSHDNPDADYNTIDYCVLFWATEMPILGIYENGALVYWENPFFHTNFKIVINVEGKIEYWETETPALLYTSTVLPLFPLFADASIRYMTSMVSDAEIEAGVVPVEAKVDHLPLMGLH